MNTVNKAKNSAAKSKGRVKVAVGRLTGNKSLQARGKRDQAKGTLRQVGARVRHAVKK